MVLFFNFSWACKTAAQYLLVVYVFLCALLFSPLFYLFSPPFIYLNAYSTPFPHPLPPPPILPFVFFSPFTPLLYILSCTPSHSLIFTLLHKSSFLCLNLLLDKNTFVVYITQEVVILVFVLVIRRKHISCVYNTM